MGDKRQETRERLNRRGGSCARLGHEKNVELQLWNINHKFIKKFQRRLSYELSKCVRRMGKQQLFQ